MVVVLNIKEKRKSKGLTQGELADILSVNQCTVSQWELGKISPPIDKLISMSDLFGCTIDELVRGGEKNVNES